MPTDEGITPTAHGTTPTHTTYGTTPATPEGKQLTFEDLNHTDMSE